MADPILHIKDSFYFEVPKFLAPAHYPSRVDFPPVWGQLDAEFQDWEFARMYASLANLASDLPSAETLQHDWHHWQHADHANAGKPFDVYLQETHQSKSEQAEGDWYFKLTSDPQKSSQWKVAVEKAGSWDEYKADEKAPEWSDAKIKGYEQHLSGKILIPQLFGAKLRNLYEVESGVAISRFMIVEVAIALILVVIFSWLAGKVRPGSAPKGRAWNLLEVFFVFIRDEIAKPALGGHDHGHDDHALVEHEEHFEMPDVAHRHGVATHERGKGPGHHVAQSHGQQHHEPDAPTRFTPLLCTIFFFVLGCNLAGMVPWVGSPTGTWGVTFGLAMVTFATVFVAGVKQFGLAGFFLNQIPTMDMHPAMGAVLKPMIFIIEMGGLLIKHAVLSVRLLANMVAGHLVLGAILGLAFGAQAALQYSSPEGVSAWWWLAAPISVLGCTLLSLLELFVAFLQAYVFTLLSALFIGASIHKH